MTTTPGFWSEKTLSPGKIISLFVADIKLHMFAFALISVGVEIIFALNGRTDGAFENFSKDAFCLSFIIFFALFSLFEHIFSIFIKSRFVSLFSVLPAILLFFLVKDIQLFSNLQIAVVVALTVRVVFRLLDLGDGVSGPFSNALFWSYFVLMTVAVSMHFSLGLFAGNTLVDRFTFISLVILLFSSLQGFFYEKKKSTFPFHYFILVGILAFLFPMKADPIDWSPLVDAGYRLVSGIADATDEFTYNLSLTFGKNKYSAGYSSFQATGDSLSGKEKTQLVLESDDKPYFVFADDESGNWLKVRRTAYLVGGRGADYENLVCFLNLMHENNVDKEYAALFSRISKVNLEYEYLSTRDEIAPINTIKLTTTDGWNNKGKVITGGASDKKHKKGYKLTARYLEIDYASPYLIELINEAKSPTNYLPYEEASKYMKDLYGTRLEDYMTEESYEETILSIKSVDQSFQKAKENSGMTEEEAFIYLDTTGASEEMQELSWNIVGAAVRIAMSSDGDTSDSNGAKLSYLTDYEKCKVIERYLRQYTYSTQAEGGRDSSSDLSSPQGMADIADRFLFETGEGYCVHFTSAMVMLLRLSGIPARVSVGFRYAYPFEKQETYEISSSLAHAWPEAYIEGVGWIPFEPTSGYLASEDFTWHRAVKSLEAKPQDYESLQIPILEEKSDELDSADTQNAIERDFTSRLFRITVIVGLSIALIVILLIIGTIIFYKLGYKYGTPEKKLELDVEQIKKSVRHHYEKTTGKDFIDRGLLSDYEKFVPDSCRADAHKVFDSYYRFKYSKNIVHISPEESDLAKNLRHQLQSSAVYD